MTQKYCIFCGKSGLTKEHFWPDWIGNQITKNEEAKYINGSIQAFSKSDDFIEKANSRSGNVVTKKFRVVCSACNNGWMSCLEEKVKPILQNALTTCDKNLNKREILLFCKWATMKCMIAEHTNLNTNSTPNDDLLAFGKTQAIPGYFKIYVAKHNMRENFSYSRTSARIGNIANMEAHIGQMGNNTQATSFTVGRLFIYVFSCTEPNVTLLNDFKLNSLKRLKLEQINQLCFKSLKSLDETSINRIVYALGDFINSVKTIPIRKW